MATPQRSFLVPLSVFTLACAAVMFGVLHLLKAPITAHYFFALLYFAAITFFLHRWQENNFAADPKGFVRRFMTGLVLKMFASIAVLVVCMLLVPADLLVPFTLCFAVLYLAYLAFGTARLMRLSRP
jgi:F0F1-type ATP synthase assembly protein I